MFENTWHSTRPTGPQSVHRTLASFSFLPARSAEADLTRHGRTAGPAAACLPDHPSHDHLETQYGRWWSRERLILVPGSSKPKGAWVGIQGKFGTRSITEHYTSRCGLQITCIRITWGCLLKIQVSGSHSRLLSQKYLMKFEHSFRAQIGGRVIVSEVLVHQCSPVQRLSYSSKGKNSDWIPSLGNPCSLAAKADPALHMIH